MTSKPLVSVVIPTYNCGHFVTEAVDSALAQTYPAVEVIVVDDGSTDDTRERLRAYGDRIRYICQDNAGPAAARNTGIRAARGEYIAFLDADDLFHPRRIELQIPVAESDTAIGIVASTCVESPIVRWEPVPAELIERVWISLDDLVLRSRFGSCGVLARRECFDVVGYFDESLPSGEDREMWMRIAARYRVVRVQAALWWYRITPGSLSRNPAWVERMEQTQRAVLDKVFQMPALAGRHLLRRKALALAELANCYMYREAGRQGRALGCLLRSSLWWPLPLRGPDLGANRRLFGLAVTIRNLLTGRGRVSNPR